MEGVKGVGDKALLHRRVAVQWVHRCKPTFFDGRVTGYDDTSGLHRIKFDDGDEEEYELQAMHERGYLRWLDQAPAASPCLEASTATDGDQRPFEAPPLQGSVVRPDSSARKRRASMAGLAPSSRREETYSKQGFPSASGHRSGKYKRHKRESPRMVPHASGRKARMHVGVQLGSRSSVRMSHLPKRLDDHGTCSGSK